MQSEHVILRPLILTEKGNQLQEEHNKFLFEVDRRANKIEIRKAVEDLFSVQVRNVNTMNMRGKMRRMGRGHAKSRNWKKAVVTLREGDTISFFEEA